MLPAPEPSSTLGAQLRKEQEKNLRMYFLLFYFQKQVDLFVETRAIFENRLYLATIGLWFPGIAGFLRGLGEM